MPPKRRSSGNTPSSHQSTLAFHGATNKVTKAGARAQHAKKNIVDQPAEKEVKPAVSSVSPTEDVEPDAAEVILGVQAEQAVAEQQATSSPEEDEARRIPDKRISDYWAAKEAARKAPRVHQKELSLHEKILTEFDLSGQYGPCVGIARLKRWKRAHRLKLNPPIEVLAVLLKEQNKDSKSAQVSRVDELLNARNVELDVGA